MAEQGSLVAPYLEWAVLTDFAYLDGEWFRVLLEVDGPAAHFASRIRDSGNAHRIWVPPAYEVPPAGINESDITHLTAIMHREALAALINERDFASNLNIRRIELGTSTADPNAGRERRIEP